jgi:hypothetical protein
MRGGLTFSAVDKGSSWQENIGELQRFGAIQINIYEPTARNTQKQPNVISDPKMLRNLPLIDTKTCPALRTRFLRTGRDRYNGPTPTNKIVRGLYRAFFTHHARHERIL